MTPGPLPEDLKLWLLPLTASSMTAEVEDQKIKVTIYHTFSSALIASYPFNQDIKARREL